MPLTAAVLAVVVDVDFQEPVVDAAVAWTQEILASWMNQAVFAPAGRWMCGGVQMQGHGSSRLNLGNQAVKIGDPGTFSGKRKKCHGLRSD